MPAVGVFPPRCSLLFFWFFFFFSLYLSVALVFDLALARFVPVTEGTWARVPPIFLAHGANRTGIKKKKRLVGALEFSWFVLCVVFGLFPEVCALDASECWNFQDICASGAVSRIFLCLQRFRKMLKISGSDEPKNVGISKMFVLGA